jgi:hypothetical protein
LGNSFDAVNAIKATYHASTLEGVYDDISKALQPRGIVSPAQFFVPVLSPNASLFKFGVYEWCMTGYWDPLTPNRRALAPRIELGNATPEVLSAGYRR